jgi:multidrug resistance efflux pump
MGSTAVWAIGAALLVVTVGGCPVSAAEPDEAANSPRKDERSTLELPGQVEAKQQARLFSRVAGQVREVLVDIGDRVKAGQVLAELAVPEVEAEHQQKRALAAQAEAEVDQARRGLVAAEARIGVATVQVSEAEAAVARSRADYDYRKLAYERFRELEKTKAIDQRLVEEAQQKLEAAKATLAEAEAKVKVAKAARDVSVARRERAQADVKASQARLEVARADIIRAEAVLRFAKVLAPFDGVVTRRAVDPGAFAGPPDGGHTEPLFVVAQLDTIRVVVALPQRDVPRVGVGTQAVVRLDAFPGMELEGKVSRIAGGLDAATRTLRAEIDLPNPGDKLLPGMFGTVALTVARAGPDDKPAPEPTPEFAALYKSRLEAARQAYQLLAKSMAAQESSDVEGLYRWSQRWLDAQRDVSAKKEDHIAALEAHLGRMRDLEKLAKNFAKAGQGSAHNAAAAEFYRADAELQLLQAKAK